MFFFFFFNDTATTEIYTLSLHDALPISPGTPVRVAASAEGSMVHLEIADQGERSEEHTSELQSRRDLVCRLLLEKKKKKKQNKQQNNKQKREIESPYNRKTYRYRSL